MPRHNLNFFLILILGAFLSACGPHGGPPDFPAAARVGIATTQDWQITYTTSGYVEANDKVDMNSEVPGTVVSINFREGQPVRKGQTLIRLKADKYSAQVRGAAEQVGVQSAEVSRLQSELEAASSRKKLAESEFNKFQQLYKGQFISAWELDQKRSALDTASADYNAAVSRVNATQAMRTKAQADYSYSQALAGEAVLRAPFSGVVGQKYVAMGDYVLPAEKILTIVDNSSLRMKFTVPERYLGYVKNGLPVLVYTETRPDKKYTARLSFIDPVVDLDSRTLMVKAEVNDPAGELKHGQSALAKLVLDTVHNAVVLPEEAITLQGERPFVYLVNQDNIAKLQAVTIGSRDTGKVYITSGVKKGDRFVLSGLQKVFDGAKISEVKDEAPKDK